MGKTPNKKPLVSVIMPVRNGATFLKEAVESILSQTYKKFELIIVDDNSTDNSWEIIKQYQKQHPRKIKLIHLPKKHGAYGAANIGIRDAKGKFIAPMDSDDVSHPKRLERQVEYLSRNRDTIVVGTWAKIIDQEGNIIGEKVFPTKNDDIYRQFFAIHPLVHPSCMVRRSRLPKQDKLYQDRFWINDDYYTFFTLFRFGKFANIPEYLLDYRIHLNNSSLQNLKQKFFNTVKIRLVAISDLGYKPTLSGILKLVGQILLVTLMPESVLLNIYLRIKGIRRESARNPNFILRFFLTAQ